MLPPFAGRLTPNSQTPRLASQPLPFIPAAFPSLPVAPSPGHTMVSPSEQEPGLRGGLACAASCARAATLATWTTPEPFQAASRSPGGLSPPSSRSSPSASAAPSPQSSGGLAGSGAVPHAPAGGRGQACEPRVHAGCRRPGGGQATRVSRTVRKRLAGFRVFTVIFTTYCRDLVC